MPTRHISTFLFLVLSIQLLSGCFAYQPVSAPGTTPAANVQVRFGTPTVIEAVSSPIGPATINEVRLIQARAARLTGDTVRLERVQRLVARGDWNQVTFEQASFLSTDSASYSTYRFSPSEPL
jgi:hypothetical protein